MRRRTSSTLPGAGAQSHTRAARACDEELRDPPRVGVPVRRRGLRGELFRGGAVRGRVSGVGTVPKQRRRDLVAPGAHGVVQRREAVVVRSSSGTVNAPSFRSSIICSVSTATRYAPSSSSQRWLATITDGTASQRTRFNAKTWAGTSHDACEISLLSGFLSFRKSHQRGCERAPR